MTYLIIEDVTNQPPITIIGDENAERNAQYAVPLPPALAHMKSPTPMSVGIPIIPETAPKSVLWGAKKRIIPDYMKRKYTPIVSARFAELIEKADPGVHQYIPVDLYRPHLKAPVAQHYWLIICRLIDCAHSEFTTHERDRNRAWEFRSGGKFVISTAAIGSSKLWRDVYIGGWIWCSPELKAELEASKFSGFTFTEFEEA